MTAADIGEWSDFGVGVAGATAWVHTKSPRHEGGTTTAAWVLTRLLPSVLVAGLLLLSAITLWAEWVGRSAGRRRDGCDRRGLVSSWVLLVEIQR